VILLQWPYNAFAWVQKRARASDRFPGICPGLGPPNRGLEQSLNPVKFPLLELSLFSKFSSLLSYLQRRCQSPKSFIELELLMIL
jgi:hypothetical protein